MSTIDIDRRPWPDFAEVIDERGWTQNEMETDDGQVCLTGSMKVCDIRPGDWVFYAEIAHQREHGETWNDEDGRTRGQVTRWLRIAKPITDAELLKAFGPQLEHLIVMVREVATWPEEKLAAFRSLCWAAWGDNSSGYAKAWRSVGGNSGPGIAAHRALGAVGAYAADAGVAAALARRHEIGIKGGITQAHYDALGRPWVAFTGTPVHPDDPAVA